MIARIWVLFPLGRNDTLLNLTYKISTTFQLQNFKPITKLPARNPHASPKKNKDVPTPTHMK
jgi:hypothetical protein